MGKFLLGAAYYPEWWDEEEWKKDFAIMSSMGINSVRMGEFAWSWYEPREGEYRFQPMQRAVELAAAEGLKTVMCTTTSVCPAWLYRKYPEVKGGNEQGLYGFGGRKGNCLSSDVFLEYAKRITIEQAKVFAHDSNVVGWQLDNEPGFPFVCYDPCCERNFRQWLKKRYGTIEALNDAWFTMVWANGYTDFEEIFLPLNAAEKGWSPGMRLDYRRFFSDNFNYLLSEEARIIREQGSAQFIFTNWPGANWSVSCEDAMLYLDYSAWDNHAGIPGYGDYHTQLRAAMEHDLCRRLSNGKNRFVVAEQPPVAQGNALHAQTWLNIAHGAFATLYWEYRAAPGGYEQGYECMLNADGHVNKYAAAVPVLAENLDKYYELIDGAETVSPAAAVYSYQNSWATLNWKVDGPYDENFFKAYGGFKTALLQNMDVVFPSDDFSKYKLVIAPGLEILSDKERAQMEQYVKDGGVLVICPYTDTRDAFNRIRQAPRPRLFDGNCGARVLKEHIAGNIATWGEHCERVSVRFSGGEEYELAGRMSELEVDEGADVLARFTCGTSKGMPAVTARQIGKGYVVMYAFDVPSYDCYEAIARAANRYARVQPLLKVPKGVLVAERSKAGQSYLIVINVRSVPAELTLDEPLFDILKQKEVSGTVKMDGPDVLFAKRI